MYVVYRDGLYNFERDWTKQMTYARKAAEAGHPAAIEMFVHLYMHENRRYVWGPIMPSDEQCMNWLRTCRTPEVRREFCKHEYGEQTPEYDKAMFQLAYDYALPLELAEYYWEGRGCEANPALSNYWAWMAQGWSDEEEGYQMLQAHAPANARIPNGEDDIIIDEEILAQARATGDKLVRINDLLDQFADGPELSARNMAILEEWAREGIVQAKRLYLLSQARAAGSRQHIESPELLHTLLQYARDLEPYDFGDVLYAAAGLLRRFTNDTDHKAAQYIVRCAMIHTGGCSLREGYQSVVDMIRSGELPISNKDVHIRYFELFRDLYSF